MTTLCGYPVDETTAEQRESHKLRFAAICPHCAGIAEKRGIATDIVFTARGARRHLVEQAE